MNRDLISKAIVLLVSYREYTGDHRMANLCGEVVEALKAELAKPEQESTSKRMRDAGYTRRSKGWEKDTEQDVTFIDEGDMAGAYMDTKQENLNMSEERVHKSEESIHEPVAWMLPEYGDVLSASETDGKGIYSIPLYAAPQKYCPLENNAAYEKGFVEGMAKQAKSSVDRAVNAMAKLKERNDE
jgi:hypothetical protein